MSNHSNSANHEKKTEDSQNPLDEHPLDDTKKTEGSTDQKKETLRQPISVTITDIELEQLRKEASENKDKYLRSLAEQENARKRLQKEREQMTQYAVQNIIADFLNPIDHFENALKFTEQMSEEVKIWGHGFQMILDQFKEALHNNGIVAIASMGKTFDPHLHEAIDTEETTEYPPGTVIEEIIKGYKMGDRIIRPARVKVAKAPSNPPSNEKNK